MVFIKAQLSAFVATALDFLVTIVLIELAGLSYFSSTIIGAIAGAIMNFTINRHWSFNKKDIGLRTQGSKYIIVWISSIGLNAIGSNYLVKLFEIPYLISKTLISVVIGLTFNYQLQKHYVFRKNN